MRSIICEECGNSGKVEMILYGGKTLNGLRCHQIFVSGRRYFKVYYHAISKELDYMPSYYDFDPNSKEHQLLYARALKDTGMKGEINKVRTWSEPCFKCSDDSTPLSLSIVPVLLPRTL